MKYTGVQLIVYSHLWHKAASLTDKDSLQVLLHSAYGFLQYLHYPNLHLD